jgi:PAS domain S-box-containing protein
MANRILLVDDDPAVRRVISGILHADGYEVREAVNGHEAFAAVEQFQPNLVLLDVGLPDGDGLEICTRLKEDSRTAFLPIALISGKAMKGHDQAAGFAAGADEYFTKPVDAEEFPARIRMLLRLAQTAAALRESERRHREAEEKYRGIFENALEGMFQTTVDGRFLSVNPALARILGYDSPQEVIDSISSIAGQLCVQPERRLEMRKLLDAGGFVRGFENEIRRKDGTIIWISISGRAVRDAAGKILYYEGTTEDITRKRQAELQLATLGHAVESSAEMICITDMQDRFTFVNPAFLNAYGYTESELLGKSPEILLSTANPPGLIEKILKETRNGGWQGEIIDRRKDGSDLPISLSTSQVKDANGKVIGLMGVARDITERKKIEKRNAALANLSYRLSSISTPAEAAVIIMDVATDLFSWDAGYLHLYSADEDKLIPLFTADTIEGKRQEVPPVSFSLEPSPLMREVMTRGARLINRQPGSMIAPGLVAFGNKARLSGSMMYVPVHFGSSVWGILSVQSYTPALYSMADLSLLQAMANHCGSALRRIEMAEALRRSERNLRLIAENTNDVIFAFDMDREPIYVNPAVEQLTGYTFAEIKEHKFVNWIHPRDQKRMLALWDDLYRGKTYSDVEFRLVTKSGQMKWCSSTWGPMRDEDGRQIGVQGRERDVTERKQLEKQVLEVSADERRRIGHELHDGLGQYLAGIALKTKALEQMLADEGSAHSGNAQELVSLVSNAISQARNLARGLDPVEVETIGLAAALQNLCAETKNVFNVHCEFVPAQKSPEVNSQTGLALYRIAQQAIHNACTHGRASAIEVQLATRNGDLSLSIRDDGRGFDSNGKASNGMGLRVMRYRARSVGGDLVVNSKPGAGAEVKCSVPLGEG